MQQKPNPNNLPMVFRTSNLNQFFFTFLFLFLFFSSFSCPISCDESLTRPAGYRVFYVKNARPLFLNRQHEVLDGRRRTGRMMIKQKKKVTAGDRDSRSTTPFTVMLPKGFVPPSGSARCHNDNPNSAVAFHCELPTQKP